MILRSFKNMNHETATAVNGSYSEFIENSNLSLKSACCLLSKDIFRKSHLLASNRTIYQMIQKLSLFCLTDGWINTRKSLAQIYT